MSQATDMLAAYIAAEAAVLLGKEATFGDRKLRMEDLAEIRLGRREWEQRVQAETTKTAPKIGGLSFSLAKMDQ